MVRDLSAKASWLPLANILLLTVMLALLWVMPPAKDDPFTGGGGGRPSGIIYRGNLGRGSELPIKVSSSARRPSWTTVLRAVRSQSAGRVIIIRSPYRSNSAWYVDIIPAK